MRKREQRDNWVEYRIKMLSLSRDEFILRVVEDLVRYLLWFNERIALMWLDQMMEMNPRYSQLLNILGQLLRRLKKKKFLKVAEELRRSMTPTYIQ